jgi:hypothetical protein
MCRLLPLLVVGVLRVQGNGVTVADPLFSLDCGPAQGVWLPPMAAVPGTPPSPPSPPVAGLLGIPFAAPPLGRSGRWKPPRDPQCWDGTFNASIRPVQVTHPLPLRSFFSPPPPPSSASSSPASHQKYLQSSIRSVTPIVIVGSLHFPALSACVHRLTIALAACGHCRILTQHSQR